MKVLHLFKTYLPDSFTGIERVIWEIAEGTAAHGLAPTVLALSRDPRPGPMVQDHHVVQQAREDLYLASTGLSLSLLGRYRELAGQSDIIHYHFPWPMMDAVHLASSVRRPAIVTYHSDVVRQRALGFAYRPIMHRFLTSVDRIVATSPNYVASSPVLQRYSRKTSVIPIGLGPSVPPQADRLDHWRGHFGEGFFLFVGALRYYKGLETLLEAARLSGLPVVVVGDGEMRETVARADLPNVTLLGALSEDDKEALLALCRALVLPSHLRSEAFGVVLAEAARAGRPMISCEIGTGTSYVNIDGETGLVVAPSSPEALAAAMQTLAADPERAMRMGRAAARRFAKHFTAAQMVQGYLDLYAEVLEASAAGRP